MIDSVAFIFARGGSKGLPGKNIRPLMGKPLIAWAIEHARAVTSIRRVIVSTDSEEIAKVAMKYGGEVPFMRPKELAQDLSPEWSAWEHALSFIQETEGKLPDAMVSVPTTAPLRMPIDIQNCLNLFSEGDADAVITVTEARRNPWFNMVREVDGGLVKLVNHEDYEISRRQDAKKVFDITTIAYVICPQFVFKENSLFSGKVRALQVPVERSVDIDTLFDFEIAEFLMSRKDSK